jgi:hypothetical protein
VEFVNDDGVVRAHRRRAALGEYEEEDVLGGRGSEA